MLEPFFSFISAFLSASLAIFAFLRGKASLVHKMFLIGMLVLSLEAVLMGMGYLAPSGEEKTKWLRLGFLTTGLLPGIWLVFSIGFARGEVKEAIYKWRIVLFLVLVVPLTLTLAFSRFFFKGELFLSETFGLSIRLGWSGFLFTLILLINSLFILINLEGTFRSSTGSNRWRIKFLVVGLGAIFSARIYTASQAILFSTFHSTLNLFNSGGVIIGCLLIPISLLRFQNLSMKIYLSNRFIYQSVTILTVGIYLILVGIFVKIVPLFKTITFIPIEAFFIFLSFAGLTILLLSEDIKMRVRLFINRHIQRPRYDYREKWREFTRRTTCLLEVRSFCSAVTQIVSETFHCSSVTIWLLDEFNGPLSLGGSTLFSEGEWRGLNITSQRGKEFITLLRNGGKIIDFGQAEMEPVRGFIEEYRGLLQEARIRYCAPLIVGEEMIGMITLNDRMTGEDFSIEDFELLRTFADQTAVHLLNLRLAENLKKLKEDEAYQTMSAFMLHDLKNLASSLSLTLQNLPTHFENLEFRQDVLRLLQQSLSKIKGMTQHLSMLSKKIELRRTEVNLNDLILSTLSDFDGGPDISIVHHLQPLPNLSIDPEQVQKVLINLILNAREAIGDSGEIRVTTEQRNGIALISVQDNGAGMSKQFMEESLFTPFRTTKRQGMGIGLFQSKMIVEAHGGRIEVESKEGKGSVFRIMLPVKRE